jgi:hypothetical protein
MRPKHPQFSPRWTWANPFTATLCAAFTPERRTYVAENVNSRQKWSPGDHICRQKSCFATKVTRQNQVAHRSNLNNMSDLSNLQARPSAGPFATPQLAETLLRISRTARQTFGSIPRGRQRQSVGPLGGRATAARTGLSISSQRAQADGPSVANSERASPKTSFGIPAEGGQSQFAPRTAQSGTVPGSSGTCSNSASGRPSAAASLSCRSAPPCRSPG